MSKWWRCQYLSSDQDHGGKEMSLLTDEQGDSFFMTVSLFVHKDDPLFVHVFWFATR